MFKLYARFSVNHPYFHASNLLILLGIFILSCYQLLANEKLEYALGIVALIIPMVIFAKSSEYKRKYLSIDK